MRYFGRKNQPAGNCITIRAARCMAKLKCKFRIAGNFPYRNKKAASPGKAAIKNFRVLDPISHAGSFDGLETLKTEVGTGSVICMANDLLPVDEKNWYVPVWLI